MLQPTLPCQIIFHKGKARLARLLLAADPVIFDVVNLPNLLGRKLNASFLTSRIPFPDLFSNFNIQRRVAKERMPEMSSQYGGRLSKQVRRALFLYVACILLIAFLSIADSFGRNFHVPKVVKRSLSKHHHQAPLKQGHLFPRKIWQTWKTGPLGFDERDLQVARTWPAKNPQHRYEVLTDSNDELYVEQHFGPEGLDRPDIVELYKTLELTIIKADLLRYLIMYVEGGIYADIDVEALKPFEKFIPARYEEKDIDMIVGVEIDQPDFNYHEILGKKSQSFCQWTFVCKPRLPVMLQLVENIMEWLNGVAKEQNKPISEITLDFDGVIAGTGPSAFTKAMLADMSTRTTEPVEWNQFHSLDESKLVAGVLVLTVEAFAAGQGHSDSGNHNSRGALVKHHYHASQWPTKHPRYNHPVHGEVERCNWVTECVKRWDEDVAYFKTLGPDEQAKQIAIKQALDAQAAQQEKDKQAQQQVPPPPFR